MTALRERSVRLTGYLERLLDGIVPAIEIVTPRDPQRRGAQLSLRVAAGAAEIANRLRHEDGVIVDTRQPDILRLAPVPLYSTHHDCWRAAQALARIVSEVR
jgi:kynureninase